MEKAKFMFKYSNKMLPISFDNYFLKLETNTQLGKKSVINTFKFIPEQSREEKHFIIFV